MDELRAAMPDFGFALYAFEPGGDVTLEVITPDGQTFQFVGPTEAAVIARALPGAAEPAALPAETAIPAAPSIFD